MAVGERASVSEVFKVFKGVVSAEVVLYRALGVKERKVHGGQMK